MVKRDDHEFAIFTEFIFTYDSVNIINVYYIVILSQLFDIYSTLLISINISISNAVK